MEKRKHQDYIYLKENYYENPKEIFIFLGNLINNSLNKNNILDIGCAKGEFIYYLNQIFKNSKFTGIDYSENLINEANMNLNNFSNFTFINTSGEDFNLEESFDVITLLGVLSYFDDLNLIFKNMNKHLKDNGTIFILGFFNKYDVDVRIQYRDNQRFDNFELGWNYHSFNSIKKTIKELNMEILNIHDFELSFNLEQQIDDPCRAWHINTEFGRMFTNGLGLLYNLQVLEIEKIG